MRNKKKDNRTGLPQQLHHRFRTQCQQIGRSQLEHFPQHTRTLVPTTQLKKHIGSIHEEKLHCCALQQITSSVYTLDLRQLPSLLTRSPSISLSLCVCLSVVLPLFPLPLFFLYFPASLFSFSFCISSSFLPSAFLVALMISYPFLPHSSFSLSLSLPFLTVCLPSRSDSQMAAETNHQLRILNASQHHQWSYLQ